MGEDQEVLGREGELGRREEVMEGSSGMNGEDWADVLITLLLIICVGGVSVAWRPDGAAACGWCV